uniref:Uncharacterized protein n=1 Tax=Oryza nivara TaxID=4536 RepID=A0A0E0H0U9_ORYNI
MAQTLPNPISSPPVPDPAARPPVAPTPSRRGRLAVAPPLRSAPPRSYTRAARPARQPPAARAPRGQGQPTTPRHQRRRPVVRVRRRHNQRKNYLKEFYCTVSIRRQYGSFQEQVHGDGGVHRYTSQGPARPSHSHAAQYHQSYQRQHPAQLWGVWPSSLSWVVASEVCKSDNEALRDPSFP